VFLILFDHIYIPTFYDLLFTYYMRKIVSYPGQVKIHIERDNIYYIYIQRIFEFIHKRTRKLFQKYRNYSKIKEYLSLINSMYE